MPGRLIIVTGTGTGIGKTHLAEALLLVWQHRLPRVVGLKPVESGVSDGVLTDAARLERASTFHVKHTAFAFPEPVSPHLAARLHGVVLSAQDLAHPIARAREEADGVIVELPGGLFSPLAPGLLNADFAQGLGPDAVLLVAPDRLGVLHDVTAAVRATHSQSLRISGIVLVAPEHADASTGRNAPELAALVAPPVLATVPRGSPRDLGPIATALLERLAG
jgi:dethiobiotin synthetase